MPPEILVLVQRYHTGLLWVPEREPVPVRDRRIRQMRAQGMPAQEIAKRTGLSRRRVWQILKKGDSET